MPILQLPKTIKWLFACSFLLLLSLALYRWAVFTFLNGLSLATDQFWPAMITGFRLDARLVGFTAIFMLLLSFVPGLHFFKTTAGKKWAFGLYVFLAFCIMVFYMADLIYLMRFKTRLQASLFYSWSKDSAIRTAFLKNSYWQILFPATALLLALFYVIIRWFHGLIAKGNSPNLTIVRIYWQVLFMVVWVFAIHGRLAKQPLNFNSRPATLNQKGWQVSLQPFQSFYDSRPIKNAQTGQVQTLKPVDLGQ